MRERTKMSGKKKQMILNMGIVFLIIVGLFIVIQAVSGLYPFGNKTNLLWDQDIQYVDYFAFLKDALLGKANFGYSFSKSLGGSLVALFGYYLGCPLNVFVVFFSKEQLPLFIFILTAVKLGVAGVTAEYFFARRFPGLSRGMQILIAAAYGLMQYVMIQLSNIMWLDGVILLPLLLWAVYRFVTQNKKAGLFLAVLFSIAINWYTGYMTGLFAILYFIYERLLIVDWKQKGGCKGAFTDLVRFGFIMVCGVLGSCFLFYPIVKGLQNGKQVFSLGIFSPDMNGSFLDIFRGFALGSIIPVVALYCGLLIFGFFLYYFMSRAVQAKEKVLSLLAVIFMFVCCWFVPFECIWSGMRYAGTYKYRYSFVVVFLILYLAAKGAERYEVKRDARWMAGIFGCCALIFYLFYRDNKYGQEGFIITIVFLVAYAALFLFARYQKAVRILIPLVFAAELILNGVMTFHMQYLTNGSIAGYQNYVTQSQRQIAALKSKEKSVFYRMDTLQKRDDDKGRCSAYLNEAMVYGYHGINHYSSTYDTGIAEMINKIGYSTETDLSIMSESCLPADSLFGVKYLLSEDNVAGYKKVGSIPEYNGKAVYENPYALDVGIQVADTVFKKPESDNPFEYQNQLYSNILGRKVELYKKVEPTISMKDDSLNFYIPASGKADLLYGYVESDIPDLVLSVDGTYRCNYAAWLSYKIFNAGTGEKDHTITLGQFTGTQKDMTPYFYYLDQDLFEKVIRELKSRQMTTEIFQDGDVKGRYKAADSGNLLFSIPYDKGWSATVNGKDVKLEKAADALMAVPIQKGENKIELTYHVPGQKSGILISAVGILLFLGICWYDRRNGRLLPFAPFGCAQ